MLRFDPIRWRQTRRHGMWPFVLKYGLLYWGVPMFVLMTFVLHPFQHGFASQSAIVHCIVWPLAGVLFGLFTWFHTETKFRRI